MLNTCVPLDNALLNGNPFTVAETDQEEENISVSTDLPPSPKYTTSEKWIMDQQKRKLLSEQTWALKQQKTKQRITACADKLKVCYKINVLCLLFCYHYDDCML